MFTETIIKLEALNAVADFLNKQADNHHENVIYLKQRLEEIKEERPDDYGYYWEYTDKASELENEQQHECIIRALIPQLAKLAK